MMKNLFLFLCLGFYLSASAQQKPHYTQYILNSYILNPALTGIENYTDIKISYRNQWQGLSGAPQTAYLSIHGAIGKEGYRTSATSYEVPGDNPRGRSYWENYTSATPHHGVGAIVMNDRTGFINRMSSFITYAYHLGITPQTSISAGFMGGISGITLDRSKIDWATLDPNDPAIGVANGEIRQWKPEFGAGVWLYSSNFVAGLAVQNIVTSKVNFSDNEKYGDHFKPHFFGTAGLRFLLTDQINCMPSVTAKYVAPLEPQVDINVKMQYLDRLWVGASYRTSEQFGGWSAMAGLNVQNIFNIGYAYDANTRSHLSTVANGSHEIIIGFLIGNSFGDTCPRNVW